nr:MAG TPA: hypothetical protein [Caudoviricetes sp.]
MDLFLIARGRVTLGPCPRWGTYKPSLQRHNLIT